MGTEKTTLEVIASTVEEAINRGLSDLGLSREEVEIEVLDEGKRNLFRFATRQARIRLSVKTESPSADHEAEYSVKKTDSSQEETFEKEPLLSPSSSSEKNDYQSEEETVVKDIVIELLQKMDVKADTKIASIQIEPNERPVIQVNIEGDDLGYLVGRKSETLNALQYLTSLMVSHKLNHWIPIQLDVQNYREKREAELRKLAIRIADQVASTGRKQYLEPMPANERRIIHMTLRDFPNLKTESIGEEPNRKVCISLNTY